MPEQAMRDRPHVGLGRIIFKNTAIIILGNAALKALNFLFGVYVVRQLGDERFGQYSVVLAFVGLFQIFAELGMSQYVMREIAQDHSKTRSLFGNLVALRFLLAIVAVWGITWGAVVMGYSPELVRGVFIYTCTFILAAFQAPLQTVLTAYERFDYTIAMTLVGQLVFIVFGTIFLFSGLGYVWLIVASLISVLPQIGLGIWAVKKHNLLKRPFEIAPRAWPRLIRSGLPFGIITLTLTIAFSIDTVMLKMFQPDTVVGWYNVAYNLIFSILFLSHGFKEAIVPSLSRTYVTDPVQVERWYYQTFRVIVIISLPIAIGGMLVAYPLIRFLYTDAFLPSALALQILIWDVPFLMFSSFCGNMATVGSEERAAARIYSINAAANVLLNLYAIPRFGLIGAAFVTVITDLISALQFYFLLRRKLHLPNMTSMFLRVMLASALMGIIVKMADGLHLFALSGLGAVVFLLRDMHLFIMVGVGAVVYLVLILVTRAVEPQEIRQVLRMISRRATPVPQTVTAPTVQDR